jgi:hypothetical protein
LIVAACIAAAGLLLIGISFIVGNRNVNLGYDYPDYKYEANLEKEIKPYYVSDMQLESFTSVDIDVVNADVDFVKGTAYGVEIDYSDSRYNPTYKVRGGELTIEDDPIPAVRGFWQLFNLNFWNQKGLSLKRGQITVYLPEAQYDTIKVVNVNGQVNVSDTAMKDLSMECVNSTINIKNVKTDSATLGSVNGRIGCEQLTTSRSLDINCVNGEIEAQGTFAGNTKLETVNGSITFNTTLTQKDYDLNISTVTGKIYLDNANLSKSFEQDNNAGNDLNAETVNGRIDLIFGK